MKKTPAAHLALLSFCGALFGAMLAFVLTLIALPRFTELLTPISQAADSDLLASLGERASSVKNLALIMGLIGAALSWFFTALKLNNGLAAALKRLSLLAWTALLVSGGVLWFSLMHLLVPEALFDIATMNGPSIGNALLWAVLGGAVTWLIISPWGLAGDLTSWKLLKRRRLPRAGALGAIFGLIAFLCAQATQRVFFFLFQLNVEVWSPFVEMRHDIFVGNWIILIFICAVVFPICFGLAPALAADEIPGKTRRRLAAAPLSVAALAALLLGILYLKAVSSYDWRVPNLEQAAGLKDTAAPEKTLLVLGFDGGPLVTTRPWKMSARYHGWIPNGEVAATESNAAELRRFLDKGMNRSRFRLSAINAIEAIHAALWNIEKSFDAPAKTANAYGRSFIDLAMRSNWLAHCAPFTMKNRSRLDTFSDPESFRARGFSALTLARAWRRFGDNDRAREFRALAEKTGADPKMLEEFDALDPRPPLTGSIRGRIIIPGTDPGDIRVGLFGMRKNEKTPAIPAQRQFQMELAAAWNAGPKGSFKFTGLSEGRYFLALIVPRKAMPLDAPQAVATKHPGIITLSRERPSFDAGLITFKAAPSPAVRRKGKR